MGKFFEITLTVLFAINLIVTGLPVEQVQTTTAEETTTLEPPNGTHKELYVIKATTYEIGILADVPDNDSTTDDGPVTRQQVDLSFFNAESNDSFINFGDIPLPVHTNVSGQIITGVAPVHIGAVQDIGDILKSLPFSGTIVNITEGDSSFVHVNRENLTEYQNQVTLDNKDSLSQLPILDNLLLPESFDEAFNSVNQDEESPEVEDVKET